MATHSPSLLDSLHWRYATKAFDSTRTIPAETWKALEESLVLTPSSYGLQPWKFLVVTDKEMKAKLLLHSWNQKQVVDCSHYLIIASRTTLDSAYIDSHLNRSAELRNVPVESMKYYRGLMIEDLVHGARSGEIAEWAGRQAYIALGQFMLAAALLQIDTCPMEGFVPAEYDTLLGLTAQGLTASVCCAVGYRHESDKYSKMPKVRFPTESVVTHL
jgi:nitroreductase